MISKILKRAFGVKHSKYAIIGGGGGGVALSGHMSANRNFLKHDITVYDKHSHYYYKPGWTMIGSGLLPMHDGRRMMKDVIPTGVGWVQHDIDTVDPENNRLILDNGDIHTYDQLIVSSGIFCKWEDTPGLFEAVNDPDRPVASIYFYKSLAKILEMRDWDVKKAIFTQPPDPITCGGAPQKLCYTTSDYWRKKKNQPETHLYQAGADIFGIPFYAEKLNEIADDYGIIRHHRRHLIEVKADENVAVFENLDTGEIEETDFDFLHAVPKMCGRPYLKGSGLEDENYFVKVDEGTLRHDEYPNVWALGDGSGVPTSKTFSALMEQVQILENNLIDVEVKGREPTHIYDGYTGCPLLVGNNKVLLAEFKYEGKIAPSFEKCQRTPRRFYYFLKKYVFPRAAYQLTRTGIWKGRKTLWDPSQDDHTDFQAEVEAEYLTKKNAQQ